MKITQVDTVHAAAYPNILWVQIHTDTGLVGLGETFRGAQAVQAQIHELVAPYLLGKDPLAIEAHSQNLLMGLFLLPLMIPPITYGIPLATVMYQAHIAGTIFGVILANMIPAVPFMILVMTPFIEQIDANLESAARVFGANTFKLFWHVLLPLLAPGILAASLLVLVRTIGMFELTFLTAGPDSQTLVVALYYAVFAAGVRAPQSVDAMAMVYMAVTLAWLLIALQFVNPTQLVSRVKEHPKTA